jgi:steroid delta-isomerase-like uncharacterized protein
MPTEQNKHTVRRFYEEILNSRNTALADELLDDNYTNPEHPPTLPKGKEGGKMMFEMWGQAFPDYRMNVEDIIGEGETVVARWSFTGTNSGAFMGMPATNKQVTVEGMNMMKFTNGKIAENLPIFDKFGMLQQMGVIPSK